MALNGLFIARDGIGYGGLAVAKDGFIELNQLNLTIAPPTITTFSAETSIDSIQETHELTSFSYELTIDYLEYLLGIDSISYDLIMESITYPPTLCSYGFEPLIDSIDLKPIVGFE